MFKRKCLIAISSLLISTVSFAGGPAPAAKQNPFNGFYVGAGIGAAQNLTRTEMLSTITYATTFGVNTTTNPSTIRSYDTSFIGALSAGYGHIFSNWFYLAGELSLNLSDGKVNDDVDKAATTDPFDDTYLVNLNNRTVVNLNDFEVDLDLKPGYVFALLHAILYARFGMAFNKLKATSSANYSYTAPPFSTTVSLPASASNNVVGVRLGLGMQALLTQHFALFLDYVYTYYGKVAMGASSLVVGQGGAANPLTVNSNVKAQRQTFLAGVNYFFGG